MYNKVMKGLTALVAGIVLATAARAVVIEGTTPSGRFKTVGVSEQGRFFVEVASGTAQHVIVDEGTVTVKQGSSPWVISTSSGPGGGGSITVVAGSAANTITFSGTVGPISNQIYPGDTDRVQGVICNLDPNLTIMIGASSVNNMPLLAGSCYSPDTPLSFVGQLTGNTTTAVSVPYAYIYHRK